jgi:branched-chain amino acid transport system substrate-binding protein
MVLSRRHVMAVGAALAALPRAGRAQSKPIRIGVLTDMVGPYAANTGAGSIAGARLAIEDFAKLHPAVQVELVSADLQLKPDVAVGIAGDWLDNQGVDLITDVPLSSAAFAIGDMVKAKDKAAIFTGGASAAITGERCGPNHLHWVYDTWSMPHAVVDATVKEGGDTWYFITADYAFGHALERDVSEVVKAAGGKVLGAVRHPLSTQDFSSFLLQAQASKAKVIGLANAGMDTVNSIKQAAEFGIVKGGQKLAGLLVFATDVQSLTLPVAQGLVLTEAFYWDLNDETRAWTARYRKKKDRLPSMLTVGVYSSTLHYLKAVQAVGSADDAKKVMAKMRELPVNDVMTKNGKLREDGRLVRDMYLFQVKSPSESKGKDDIYTLVATVPGDKAYRPMNEGKCPFVK